jgi:hypothetical protein
VGRKEGRRKGGKEERKEGKKGVSENMLNYSV